MRFAFALSAILIAAPALANEPTRAVRIYTDCVTENVRNPGEEKSNSIDGAIDLAKTQCGNLRPAAVDAVRKSFGKRLTVGDDDADVAAQAFLDITVEEQAASIWAKLHPQDVSHAR